MNRAFIATAASVAAAACLAAPATADPTQTLAPGASLNHFSADGVTGELLTVDLTQKHLRVDLLHPGSVGQRATVTDMVAAQHAIAGVNGDFFDLDESQHPGVAPTGSSDGPAVANRQTLKAAVPDKQRFGPALEPGVSTRDVIGVGQDGRARLGTLTFSGTASATGTQIALTGLNQFALAQNSVGVFTSDWGTVSRQRAVCGSDTQRADPCTTDVAEVLVHDGRVAAVTNAAGAGAIAPGDTVLLGRETGADQLRKLPIGNPITVHYSLDGQGVPFQFAVGGAPILRDGNTIAGVDTKTIATRTGAGVSSDGRTLYLVTLDSPTFPSGGITLAQLATLLAGFGAADGIEFDGGGSTTMGAVLPGSTNVTMVNQEAPGVAQRPVANGIGVFAV
jgi:Phosphodiester glycosidase